MWCTKVLFVPLWLKEEWGGGDAWWQDINNRSASSITASFLQLQSEGQLGRGSHPAQLSLAGCRHPFLQPPGTRGPASDCPPHLGPDTWFPPPSSTSCTEQAQLTVIMFAERERGAALWHRPVEGIAYFSASFKRRPVAGLWRLRTAAQTHLVLFSFFFRRIYFPQMWLSISFSSIFFLF